MRAGWVLKTTTLMGDGGIHVTAFHTGLVRIPSTWDTIRGQLADFTLAVQSKPEWQDSFMVCQDVTVAGNDLSPISCMVANRTSALPEWPRMARVHGRVLKTHIILMVFLGVRMRPALGWRLGVSCSYSVRLLVFRYRRCDFNGTSGFVKHTGFCVWIVPGTARSAMSPVRLATLPQHPPRA